MLLLYCDWLVQPSKVLNLNFCKFNLQMDIEHVVIVTGKICHQLILVADMDLFYWSVRSSSRRERELGYLYFSQLRALEYMNILCNIQVSNNISIAELK